MPQSKQAKKSSKKSAKKRKQQRGAARSAARQGPISDFLMPTIETGVNALEGIVTGIVGNFFGKSGGAPVAKQNHFRSRIANRSVESGQEQVGSITIPAGTPAGTVVYQSVVNGLELGTRIAKITELWARTRFNQLVLVVEAANSTFVPGSYIIAYDQDPTTDYNSSPDLPQRLMALSRAAKTNAWNSVGIPALLSRQLLYNRFSSENVDDAEIRQYADGQFVIATATDYAEEAVYTINIAWDVSFEAPNTAEDLNSVPFVFAASNVPWTSVSTSEVTMDESPWSPNTPPDAVYSVIPGALQLQYLQGSGHIDVKVNSITVAAGVTSIQFTNIGSLGSTGKFQNQTPSVYYLPQQAFMVVAGLAQISRSLAKPGTVAKHVEWFCQAKERARRKTTARLFVQEQERRLTESLKDLSETDLGVRSEQLQAAVSKLELR